MNNSIHWYPANRESLADFTIERKNLLNNLNKARREIDFLSTSELTIGLVKESASDASVALFVVSDSDYRDFFSWVNTFLPDAFPLSQFARVLLETDARNLQKLLFSKKAVRNQGEQWCSIVLGELLGQGGSENDVASVPYSRAAACFSTTIARTWMLYDSEMAAEIATKRLRRIESDSRFVRRSVTLRDLDAIWDLLINLGDTLFDHKPEAIVDFVCRAAEITHEKKHGLDFPLMSLENFPGLRSSSVEERVISFQHLVNGITMLKSTGELPALATILAGAVFLVGKGTSHAFLLKRVPALTSVASAWFGLMAALAGPTSWDSHWQRACRGIGKVVRQNFQWSEPAMADLAWAEFDWMAPTFDGYKMFESVSKTVAKVLSIEVMPGAICQLRLAASSDDTVDQQRNSTAALLPSKKEIELEFLLDQFLELANKIEYRFKFRNDYGEGDMQKRQSYLFEAEKNFFASKPIRGLKK